jgi:hypothetical protein
MFNLNFATRGWSGGLAGLGWGSGYSRTWGVWGGVGGGGDEKGRAKYFLWVALWEADEMGVGGGGTKGR